MSIEFDRDAVGVQAQARWNDANLFGSWSGFVSLISTRGCICQLPAHIDSSGTSELETALYSLRRDIRWVLAEFSDTCSLLGSGATGAAADFDETEKISQDGFDEMNAILGGGDQ